MPILPRIPSPTSPLAFSYVGTHTQDPTSANATNDLIFEPVDLQFNESGSSSGNFGALQTKQAVACARPAPAE